MAPGGACVRLLLARNHREIPKSWPDAPPPTPSARGRGRRAGQGRAGLRRPERRAEPEAHRDAGDRASGGFKELGRQAELLRAGICTLGGALSGWPRSAGSLRWFIRSISAADAIGRLADKIGSASRRCRSCASPPRRRAASSRRWTWRCNASSAEWPRPPTARMGIALRDQRRSGPKQLGPE